MAANKPKTHLQEAEKLTADGFVDLYEIRLKTVNTILRIKNNNSVTYLGNFYEGFPCEMSGEKRSSDDEESRPQLRIMNPEGVFNSLVRSRLLDQATVIRRRALLAHVTGNVNIFQQRMWYVSRPSEVIAGQSVTLELRGMTEGPNIQIPARMFIPPAFPMVRLR